MLNDLGFKFCFDLSCLHDIKQYTHLGLYTQLLQPIKSLKCHRYTYEIETCTCCIIFTKFGPI